MNTENLVLHDKIAQLCLKHFESLPKTGKPNQNEWTILSCIVLEDNNIFEVIALGTGSKCIGKSRMSQAGDILNDSHAEVICRRAFLRYLYENMIAPKTSNVSLLTFNNESKKFRLKDTVRFHFFTTHVPCGDAAIFSKQDSEDFGNLIEETVQGKKQTLKRSNDSSAENANKKMKLSEDIFRTGAKCLEEDKRQDLKLGGAEYHVVGVVRTKPGRGDCTLSVSCSDKIAKWCHLGVQGALLSILIDNPVYLHSFTIAGNTPFSKESLERALYDRLKILNLKLPYRRNKMMFGQSSLVFSYRKSGCKNPCPTSIAWLQTDLNKGQIEVAVEGRKHGITKKQLKRSSNRLKISKVELFHYFTQVTKTFEIELENIDDISTLSYKNAKFLARNYQENWNILKQSFKIWTEKEDNLLQFCIE